MHDDTEALTNNYRTHNKPTISNKHLPIQQILAPVTTVYRNGLRRQVFTYDISDTTTLSRDSNQGFPQSALPPSLLSSSLPIPPQPTTRRRLVPVLESLSNPSTAPVLSVGPTRGKQLTNALEPARLSYSPQLGPPHPLYNLPSTTRVVLVDQIDHLIHLDRALKLSCVVGVSSLLVTNTHPSSSREHRRRSTNENKFTGLLQLACETDDCVYVVDTTAFLEDDTDQLSRIIGEFLANQEIRKVVFNWHEERPVLEHTFPFLKLQENQIKNFLDLGHVWCRFSFTPQATSDDQNVNTSTAENTQSQVSSAGDMINSSRCDVAFWSTHSYSSHMINLTSWGTNVALKKISGKRLDLSRSNWERRPLTNEQVDRAG